MAAALVDSADARGAQKPLSQCARAAGAWHHVGIRGARPGCSDQRVDPVRSGPENPDTTAQAQRLASVLRNSGVPVKVFGARESTHNQINANLGMPGDPATKELFAFVDGVLKP